MLIFFDVLHQLTIFYHNFGGFGKLKREIFGGLGGFRDGFCVGERGDFETQRTVLEGAVNFARAAELQIDLGEVEAVSGFFELTQAARGGRFAASDEEAVGFRGATADAAAELVELGEAVVLGIHDDDVSGVGDIDADFDDGGGDKDVDGA